MVVRKNQRNLNSDEQMNFLLAWQSLNSQGPLAMFVSLHSFSAYLLHSGNTPPDWGSWRFLPWHRSYLYQLEQALHASGGLWPDIGIPYWDWSNKVDQAIPQWLQNITESVGNIVVTRNPGVGARTLPPPEDVVKLNQINTYLEFTQCLEMGNGCDAGQGFRSAMHNQVHQWVGGTMNLGETAPADIIFWMHHANVDRIWSDWQKQHPNEYPNGLGCKLDPKAACDNLKIPGHEGNAYVLDPFKKQVNPDIYYIEPDCRSIQQLGYSYV